jgi:hypothetical protein
MYTNENCRRRKETKIMSSNQRFSRRSFMQTSGLAAVSVTLGSRLAAPVLDQTATPEPPVANGDQALLRLLEGNQRYAAGKPLAPNQSERRRIDLVGGQNPFAVVFGCVDSRVPSELIFDRGLGIYMSFVPGRRSITPCWAVCSMRSQSCTARQTSGFD